MAFFVEELKKAMTPINESCEYSKPYNDAKKSADKKAKEKVEAKSPENVKINPTGPAKEDNTSEPKNESLLDGVDFDEIQQFGKSLRKEMGAKDPANSRSRFRRELAAEDDYYDRAHGEGTYAGEEPDDYLGLYKESLLKEGLGANLDDNDLALIVRYLENAMGHTWTDPRDEKQIRRILGKLHSYNPGLFESYSER